MWIKNITIENCRLLNKVNLELSQHLNLIVGPNASGKTSLLEALNILSKGRSFRTSHINEVISKNKDTILVAANISKTNTSNIDTTSRIGIEKSPNKTKIRINKKDVFSQAELSSFLPITVIHPNSIELITGSPSLRRSFLDWIAFYRYPEFHTEWKKYKHILKQRNMCLKFNKHNYSIDDWTKQLVSIQPNIIKYRKEVLLTLQPIVNDISTHLLNGIDVQLEFKTGFPSEVNITHSELLEFYISKLEYDKKIKRTSAGCHRADFNIKLDNISAMECASRGQLKLLAICLLLAQSNCIANTNTGDGVLLIDDLAAELDSHNKKILLEYLSSLNKQLIITSTQNIEFQEIQSRVFHVKHGEIN